MTDRVFFSTVALAAAVMAALALAWPQGLGLRSPPPFGHALADPNPKKAPTVAPSILPIPAEAEGEVAAAVEEAAR